MPRSNAGNPDDDDLIARGGKVDRERLFELYELQTGDDEQPISVHWYQLLFPHRKSVRY